MLFSMHKTFVCSHVHMYWLHAYIIIFQYACTCIKCKWLTWRKEYIYIHTSWSAHFAPIELASSCSSLLVPCQGKSLSFAALPEWWDLVLGAQNHERWIGGLCFEFTPTTHSCPFRWAIFFKKTPGLTVTASNGVEKGNYQLSFRGRAARLADVWMFYHWEEEMSPL